MTPLDVLAWLAGGGFSVKVRDGRLWVSPASKLSEADKELVVAHRAALLECLGGGKAPAVAGDAAPAVGQKRFVDEEGLEWR